MATTAQLTKWSAQVLALIDNGITDVDTIIAKRNGARMSTLWTIKQLCATDKVERIGNILYRNRNNGQQLIQEKTAGNLPKENASV